MSHHFKQESATHSPKNLDTLDIDQYLNLDQTLYPSPSTSTSSSSRGKSIDTTDYSRTFSNNTLVPRQQQSQQPTYAGPSHQYDSYPQQTGFVAGAYTSAVASARSSDFSSSFPDMDIGPIDGYFGGMDTINEDFDFNSLPSHSPSFSTSVDTEMAFDSPVQDMFSSQSSNNYVDPTVIGGQEDESAASTPVQPTNMRVWPGMHQQQAMTKAQQQQRQQLEQQQKMVQSARVAPPLPQPKKPASKSAATSSNRPPTDPIVEERISRLLSQMRQQCDTQSKDEGDSPSNNASHYTRHRKDEEDMDEDERLLASEEGKKLSSKERRQLRNKVSARAFRSRRKEYIGQLEGEIAGKVKEADELRASNDALSAENTRLTDLTRMLLSSPAFSTFLNDLSPSGGATAPSNAAQIEQAPVPSNTTPQIQPNTRKDANPHQQAQPDQNETNVQVGMMMMPETTMDYSVFNPTNYWAGNMEFGNFNAQVFSVLELPQGPAVDHIDSEHLSGKTSTFSDAFSFTSSKKDMPVIEEEMPCLTTQPAAPLLANEAFDDEFDDSDPAFALFADNPAPAKSPSIDSDSYQVFGSIELDKAFARIDLVDDSETQLEASQQDTSVSSATMARFHRICSSMDMAAARIEVWTAHL